MLKRVFKILLLMLILVGVAIVIQIYYVNSFPIISVIDDTADIATELIMEAPADLNPLSIDAMRSREYAGSSLNIIEDLPNGTNYTRQVVSYDSDGLEIFALLTVPTGTVPEGGWPVIVFNHGYIPPEEYRTTERYVSYLDYFARNGYVVIKSDYRGHGGSEGNPEGGYFSPGYTYDVLNAVASIKTLDYVDKEKIGMWGHSMGGSITLRSMVVTKDIKAGVIWAGVVGSYDDIFYNWRRSEPWQPSQREVNTRRSGRTSFVEKHGEPKDNPEFWNSLSPTSYLTDISGPIQIHHGTKDSSVPFEFSEKLHQLMLDAKMSSELFIYDGADHNLSGNAFGPAMKRSLDFFNLYLK